MPSVALRIFRGGHYVGTLGWDRAMGTVSGYMADEIAMYGTSPWYWSPLSFGDSVTPALFSNDGFIALLFWLNLSTPDLSVAQPAVDNDSPGAIY